MIKRRAFSKEEELSEFTLQMTFVFYLNFLGCLNELCEKQFDHKSLEENIFVSSAPLFYLPAVVR